MQCAGVINSNTASLTRNVLRTGYIDKRRIRVLEHLSPIFVRVVLGIKIFFMRTSKSG